MTANRTRPVRKWSEAEDSVLIQAIGENPLNLRMCFIVASSRTGRSPAACANRWYTKLANSPKRRHTALITIGGSAAVRNKKRWHPDLPVIAVREGIFSHLLDLLFGGRDEL